MGNEHDPTTVHVRDDRSYIIYDGAASSIVPLAERLLENGASAEDVKAVLSIVLEHERKVDEARRDDRRQWAAIIGGAASQLVDAYKAVEMKKMDLASKELDDDAKELIEKAAAKTIETVSSKAAEAYSAGFAAGLRQAEGSQVDDDDLLDEENGTSRQRW